MLAAMLWAASATMPSCDTRRLVAARKPSVETSVKPSGIPSLRIRIGSLTPRSVARTKNLLSANSRCNSNSKNANALRVMVIKIDNATPFTPQASTPRLPNAIIHVRKPRMGTQVKLIAPIQNVFPKPLDVKTMTKAKNSRGMIQAPMLKKIPC